MKQGRTDKNIGLATQMLALEKVEGLSYHIGSQKRVLITLLIAVCIVVFTAHLPVLSAQAMLVDDSQYLINNLLVRNPSWASARRFLTEVWRPSSVRGYYQPLTMISLMVDYAFGGRPNNLRPFHRTSLVLHIANTALVVVLLFLLFGNSWVAAGLGLLFGLHPMTVEPIAWVSDRKTILAAFFTLWSLIFYVRFARNGTGKLYICCLVMYVLALMSKPTSTPLPLLMLLIDYWPLRRLRWAAILEKLPLFIIGGVFAIITYISQSRTAGALLPHQHEAWRVPLIICHNIIFYLCKILWPANLSSYYSFPHSIDLSHPAILIGVIGTCILVLLLVVSLRWTRIPITGFLFFFVAILPTMQIVGFSQMIAADKYVYLPSLGLMLPIAAFLNSLWIRASSRQLSVRGMMLAICIVVCICCEFAGTRRHLRHWRDSITLHRYMLTINPNSAGLHSNLGVGFMKSPSDLNDAIYHFRRAVEIDPLRALYHYNLASALARSGKTKEATKHLREALHLNRNYIPAISNLARILATHPDSTIHNADESLGLAKRAAQLTGHRSVGVLDTLAAAWAANGYFDQAAATAKKALWVASMTNEQQLINSITEQLELYQQGKPYYEDPTRREVQSATDVLQEQLEVKDDNLGETPL